MIFERTSLPYSVSYPDDFDTEKYKTRQEMITIRMHYKNRYIRIAVDPIFITDSEDKVGDIMTSYIKRIIDKEEII